LAFDHEILEQPLILIIFKKKCFQFLVFRSPGDLTGTTTTSKDMSDNTRDETEDITDSLESDDVDEKSDIAASYLDMLSSFMY
jgi:hypothetical protein